MTIDSPRSQVYYKDYKSSTPLCLISCGKDDVEESFKKLNIPTTCYNYIEPALATLKALSMFDLGAVLEIRRDEENNVGTIALEIITFDSKELESDTLSVPRSVIAIMSMLINAVEYNEVLGSGNHEFSVLETNVSSPECKESILRYCRRSDDILDVTFLYALIEHTPRFSYVKATYDMSTNEFKDSDNKVIKPSISFNVKDDYEKLFKH